MISLNTIGRYAKIFQIYTFAVFKFLNINFINLQNYLIINKDLMIKKDKPLVLEYSGNKKWYTYKMFEFLQYGQSDNEISKRFEQTKQIPFEFSNPVSREEEDKGEQNDQSSSSNRIDCT